ncbi:hypothetical protein C7S18_04060 [Ahniella affigens]|uniref:Fatty acid hydroxylase domain-containing protein n=1 Tax=Ahniella affigens TaxID=2021234 RepID=A0A2P1PNK0_9GAMM|nr:sterol desaturase family protein [Ahniella affigens]AVP96418.1 hypothetical protein C7S18_04060 [Ahniella affigens]
MIWVLLSVPIVYALLIIAEQRYAAVPQSWDSRWQALALLRFAVLAVINTNTAGLIQWFTQSPRNGLGHGLAIDVVSGFLLATLGNALLHRLLHSSDFLWRQVHRFHHEPERFDTAGVMWQSIGEMALNAVVFGALVILVLDLPILPTSIVAALSSLYGLFQHMNLRTPAWLGPWIQRPESHRIHHQRHHHRDNYSDFPVWDLIFGGYRNGKTLVTDIGIGANDSGAMARSNNRPLHPAWVSLTCLFLPIYLAVYGLAYGPTHFLQWCHVGLLLTLVAILRESSLLLSIAALSSPVLALIWLSDVAAFLIFGHGWHGGTGYLFTDTTSAAVRLLSWFHVLLPLVHALLLRRLGFRPSALPIAALLGVLVFTLSVWLPGDLNYVRHGPSGLASDLAVPTALLRNVVLLVAVLLAPGYWIWLLWTKHSPSRADQPADC